MHLVYFVLTVPPANPVHWKHLLCFFGINKCLHYHFLYHYRNIYLLLGTLYFYYLYFTIHSRNNNIFFGKYRTHRVDTRCWRLLANYERDSKYYQKIVLLLSDSFFLFIYVLLIFGVGFYFLFWYFCRII